MTIRIRHNYLDNPSLTGQIAGPDATVGRTGQGSTVDEDGWIRIMQSGEARFPGAVLTHNLAAYSNDFSNSSYVKLNASVAQDAVGRDGVANSAWTITADGLAPDSNPEQTGLRSDALSADITIGKTYLISFYVKPGTKDIVFVYNSAANGTSNTRVYFDLSTGSILSESSDLEDAGIRSAGNGWYRCWVVFEDVNDNNRTYISAADTDGISGIDNSGAAQDVLYIQDFMLEDVSGKWDSMQNRENSDNCDITSTADATWTPNTVTGPFGVPNSAGTFEVTSTTNPRAFDVADTGDSIGDAYFMSFYAKAGVGVTQINPLFQGIAITATYTLTGNGAAVLDTGNGSVGIEKIGTDGWYRCWAKGVVGDANLSRIFYRLANAEEVIGNQAFFFGSQYEFAKPNQTAPSEYISLASGLDPVFNYSPSSHIPTTTDAATRLAGASEGLLNGEARTNEWTFSEDASSWDNIGVNTVITTNQYRAPDGALTADIIGDDGLGGSSFVRAGYGASSVSTSTWYTGSVFAKALGSDFLYFHVDAFTTPANGGVWFNLSTGAVGTENAGITGRIEDWGNGWYRCSISFQTDAADVAGNVYVGVADADGVTTATRDGNSTLIAWGAQFEVGSTASSYIPNLTTGSTTRNADNVQIGGLDTAAFPGGEFIGTVYCDYSMGQFDANSVDPAIYAISDGGSGTYYSCRVNDNNGNLASAAFNGGGATPGTISANISQSPGDRVRVSCRFAEDDCKMYAGIVGGSVVEGNADTTYTPYTDADQVTYGGSFGSSITAEELLIKEFIYDDAVFTNEELEDSIDNGFPLTGAFGNTGRRKANAAALWYHQMQLKQEDEEALKLIRKILG